MWKQKANWNLLLFVGLLELTLTGSCSSGWFGTGCFYMCHCSSNATCDLTTGECPPKVYCAKGYFGPGCQFADLLTEMGSLHNLGFLVDGNKSTCNPDPTATLLTVWLNHPSTISWFRIHTNIDMSNRGMYIRLNDGLCEGLRMYRVSEKILDVTCDSPELATKLLIKGPVVGHTCEVEISGGRNVALNQVTSQSSIYHDNENGKAESSNAVDGNKDNEFAHESCSHTGYPNDSSPWWQITLNRPEKIFHVVIVNRDGYRFRLNGFKLDIYSESSTQPILTETGKENDSAVYYIDLPSYLAPVHKITITKKFDPDLVHNCLTLCEVELYNEHLCGEKLFGLYCNQSCSCEVDQKCHPVTGACGTPCVNGQADLQCSYPCHPNCLDNLCRDGECVSCQLGFFGAYCEDVGNCPAGKYGVGCTLNCPKNCQDSKCNLTTGHCQACVGKQLLPLCDKEPDYGQAAGDKKKEDEFSYLYLLLPLLLLIPVCLICLCCFMRRRKEPVEEENVPKAEPTAQGPSPDELEDILKKGSSVDVHEELGSMTSLADPTAAP